MKSFHYLSHVALCRVLLMLAADKATGGTGSKTATAAAPTEEQVDQQMRAQARLAARTLREKAEQRAKLQSDAAGNPAPIEPTPTEEELYQQAKSGKAAAETPAGVTSGPTPATAESVRPGETYNGPATGRLATGAPVPEHRIAQTIPTTPTINAPGLGADSGIKKTADNPDARGGGAAPDPADNIRTPEMPNPNADASPVHGDKRQDTPEVKAARDVVSAKIRNGEEPSRDELTAAGIPESELDNAAKQAKADAEAVRARREAGTSGALPGTVAADPAPAAIVTDPKIGEKVTPTGDGTGTTAPASESDKKDTKDGKK